jgi:TldD protein
MDLCSKSLLQNVISQSLSSGGDYAEIFCEDTTRNTITMTAGAVSSALSGRDFGLSLRVFAGLRCAYGYTNDLSEASLLELVARVSEALSQPGAEASIQLSERLLPNAHAARLVPSSLPNRRKAEVLRALVAGAQGYHDEIASVTGVYRDVDQKVLIATSDGSYCGDRRVYTRASVTVIAASDGQSASGQHEICRLAGFETLEDIDVSQVGRLAAQSAVANLHAVPCPSGSMPVVIAGGTGGTFIHEACGHALEASSVASGSSYCSGLLGQKIASEKVTVYDSATLPNYWGSFNMDDEGVEAHQTLLIENGILKGYMVDRLNGRRMNMPPTGNGRKQSYRYLPTSRMTNTYIAPGTDSEEDIFSGIDQGLYVKEIGGGNANTATSEFSFGVAEGYLIRNGCLAGAVKGATIIGKAREALFEIDRVGADLGFGGGMCGASSGNVPVGDGVPTIRIRKLTVGGTF